MCYYGLVIGNEDCVCTIVSVNRIDTVDWISALWRISLLLLIVFLLLLLMIATVDWLCYWTSKIPLLPAFDCIGLTTVDWCVIADHIATFDCIPVLWLITLLFTGLPLLLLHHLSLHEEHARWNGGSSSTTRLCANNNAQLPLVDIICIIQCMGIARISSHVVQEYLGTRVSEWALLNRKSFLSRL